MLRVHLVVSVCRSLGAAQMPAALAGPCELKQPHPRRLLKRKLVLEQ